MIVAISQPMYFPWIGFMEMMKLAEVFIWLDDAQFSKGGFTNRIQVKLPSRTKWMTVPLRKRGTNTLIKNLQSDGVDWKHSHSAMLRQSFRGAPHDDFSLSIFDAVMQQTSMVDCLIESCESQASALHCKPKEILRSSRMGIEGSSWQRVLDLVKAVGGDHYVSGRGGLQYLDHMAFEENGVDVSYMNYDPLEWPQRHGEFSPFVTALDLIASVGNDSSTFLRPSIGGWRDQLAGR